MPELQISNPLQYMIYDDQIATALSSAEYVFAKTMPTNPHWYTLVYKWKDKALFYEVVKYIRKHGVIEMFWRKPYTVFFMNGYKYWTMGAPLEETILINRKPVELPHPYDAVENYTSAFSSEEDIQEECDLWDVIGRPPAGAKVIDVGCGDGMLLRNNPQVAPNDYLGLDPSITMVNAFKQANPGFEVLHTSFEHLHSPKADFVYALFGTASYIHPDEREKFRALLKPGGKAVLMFYANTYKDNVTTHKRFGIRPDVYEAEDEIQIIWPGPGDREYLIQIIEA